MTNIFLFMRVIYNNIIFCVCNITGASLMDSRDEFNRQRFHVYPPQSVMDPRRATDWGHLWLKKNSVYPYKFVCYYASPTSGEAYRDRRLTTNFELWVEIFCVPTCFHMRIPKPCLSVRLSVRLSSPREKISS